MKRPLNFLFFLSIVGFALAALLFAPVAFGADADADGVEDSDDLCLSTGPSEVVDPDGCSINDRCPCSGPAPGMSWMNHGEYVSCVAAVAGEFSDQGLIARSARGEVIREAARSGCGKEPVEVTETLTIIPFMDSPDIPAGEGALIFIDGIEVGATGAEGIFTIELAANREYSVRGLVVGLVGGDASIFLEPSETGTQSLEIIMKSEDGVTEDAGLVIDGVAGRILDAGFSELALQFQAADGSIAPLTFFDYLFLRSPTNVDAKIDVTSLFELESDGHLVLTGVEAFRSALLSLPFGEVGIEAYGEDARGFIYSGVAEFFVGRFSVSGWLDTPPSNPGLNIENLSVEARFLSDTDIVRNAPVESDGTFFFSSLPAGNWELSASTTDGDLVYNAFATISVVGNIGVIMTLRTTEDILSNVPPFEVTTFVGPTAAAAGAPDRETADENYFLPQEFFTLQSTSASISVIAGAQNVAITDSAALTVPQGTETIVLEYLVASAEFPFFVLSQSIFNDVWSLTVVGSNGGQLFQLSRQVNSMIFIPPFFQPDGTTGLITEQLNVAGLTTSGDAQIVVTASSTNIGDSILPTSVLATLGFEPTLQINQVIPDAVSPTKGDSSFYSIPRPGDTNTFSRTYTLKISRPDNTTITNVQARLLAEASGGELMTIVDQAPGTLVTEVDDSTLEVVVTMGATNPSTVASTPPPVHNILHQFEIEGEVSGNLVTSEPKASNRRRALWVLPDSVPRKGFRDAGGDGWSAKGTYEWLAANVALVPRVDDISGEHARDIGHTTHARGTDMDTFHFTDLTSPGPLQFHGGTNYSNFRDSTIAALGGDAAARATVSEWITDSRQGLAAIASLNTVAELIYHRGAAHDVLPSGWARTLLETGVLTDTSNRTLDLGLGSFAVSKVRYRNDHNDHLHIDLNDAALNNNP